MPYLDELAKWPTWEEYVICGLMSERGYWHHLPLVGAVKRVKPTSESSMRLATKPLWLAALRKVTRPLMQAKARWETTPALAELGDAFEVSGG